MLCVEWTHPNGWLREIAWTIWTVPYLLIVGGQELSEKKKDKAENLDEYYGLKIRTNDLFLILCIAIMTTAFTYHSQLLPYKDKDNKVVHTSSSSLEAKSK